MECESKDRVAYLSDADVCVLDQKGLQLKTLKVAKGWKSAYLATDDMLRLYRSDDSNTLADAGRIQDFAKMYFHTQGKIRIAVGPGSYVTVFGPELPISMKGSDRYSGVGVHPNGTTVALLTCPFNRTYLREAKYVTDHWTWMDTVQTPDISMEGSGVFLLPGYNDVRFISEDKIAFLAQISEPKEFPKDTLDLTATAINGQNPKLSSAPIYLVFSDLRTGFCLIKAKLKYSRSGGADYGAGVGKLTVSSDLKWLYIRVGDNIWRLPTKWE